MPVRLAKHRIVFTVALAILAVPPGVAHGQISAQGPQRLKLGDLVPSGTLMGRTIPFGADGQVELAEDRGWIRTTNDDYVAFRLTFSLRASRLKSQVFLGTGTKEWRAIEPLMALPLLSRTLPKQATGRADRDDGVLFPDAYAADPASRLRPDDEWQAFELRRWPHGATELLINGEPVLVMSAGCCPPVWIGFKVVGEPVALRDLVVTRMAAGDMNRPLVGEPVGEMPVPTRQPTPRYTAEALGRGVTGMVMMAVLVDARGAVRGAHVLKSLDAKMGLDREALRATHGWQFRPARIEGKAVPAIVTVEMSFSIGSPR